MAAKSPPRSLSEADHVRVLEAIRPHVGLEVRAFNFYAMLLGAAILDRPHVEEVPETGVFTFSRSPPGAAHGGHEADKFTILGLVDSRAQRLLNVE